VRSRLPSDSARRANGEHDGTPARLIRSAGTWVLDTTVVRQPAVTPEHSAPKRPDPPSANLRTH
jgi:hypothetical protein